ncbi:hypothetical protein GALMADRAFT_119757 [Galerina marginata CBS 339.88]|uniref:F-box domain-containing protein n=1 Tax=Galerina marginata (strain CBS 339.88) TaxID=685588 RepID=A0A067T3B6_GALM3|nr:hypothetical protein GALMADRAFT_119757 [Galerina marginata CBS 339.88]
MLPATTDDMIFSHLSPADLLKYSRTSRTAHKGVTAYMRRTFRIQRLLSQFLSPAQIHYFRYWQCRNGMFISGSTALQFFNRQVYEGSDLDLYVEHRYCRDIAYWLRNIGYSYVPRKTHQAKNLAEALEENMSYDNVTFAVPIQTTPFFHSTSMGYFGRGVANVYNFHKEDPPRKVQLITSFHSPMEVILNFHSTCVMNVITHDMAYSLYPHATFEERRSLIISTEGSKQDHARAKYAKRGWSLIERPSLDETKRPVSDFATGLRYVGDSRCWKIPILPEMDIPSSFIESNSWQLTYNESLEGVMSFSILLTDNLRYSYLVVDKETQDYLSPALLQDRRPLDEDVLKLLTWSR